MPNTPYDIPLDLELLRVGLHMDETYAVARYRLSGRDGDFFCLVRDAQDADKTNLVPAIRDTLYLIYDHCGDPNLYYDEFEAVLGIVWTNGLAENDPETYAAHEWTPVNDDFSLIGHITSVEKMPPGELNERSPLTERKIRNVQMAFDNLDPELCLGASQLLATYDLDSWSAFEVCSAVMDYLPDKMVSPLAENGRDPRQVRELRRIAERIYELEPDMNNPIHQVYAELTAKRDLSAEYLHQVNRVLAKTGRDFAPAWLRLDAMQLSEVAFSIDLGVPLHVVRLYSTGELGHFSHEAMSAISNGWMRGVRDDDLIRRLANPAYDADQIQEVEEACVMYMESKIPMGALALICNPMLPQSAMNALRIGFAYNGLSVDAACELLTPDVTAEQVWDLIEAKDAPGEVAEAEPVTTGDTHEQPQHGTLWDTERSQRKASDKLSVDEGHEALEPTCEEKE